MNIEDFTLIDEEPELDLQVERLLESCDIDPSEIDPKPIGRGGNHKVYGFANGEKVVKVPINQGIGTVGSADEEKYNIELYLEYFPGFSVPTSFLASPLGYCVMMNYVNGEVVTQTDIVKTDETGTIKLTPIGEQLAEIIKCNQSLINETGKMIDLVGLEGLIRAIASLHPKYGPARLTNILMENSRLRIIDYDLISLNPKSPFDKLKSAFAFQLNQQTILYHFGINFSE